MKTLEMTPERVREKLGLRPWSEWTSQVILEEDLGPARRSGRTTRMLVNAVSDALNGRDVVIIAYDPYYAVRLVGNARDYMRMLGSDQTNRIFANSNVLLRPHDAMRSTDLNNTRLYVDHTAVERETRRVMEAWTVWNSRTIVKQCQPYGYELRMTVYEMLLGDDPFESLV